jgi:branched-chain amino acid transport system permease protein
VTLFLQQLLNGLSLGAIYALIALGYTMVYGTLQLINFAHGEVYMMGAFAAMYAARWGGFAVVTGGGAPRIVSYSPVAGTPGLDLTFTPVAQEPTLLGVAGVALAGMAFSGVLGMAIERLAYRPMRKSTRLNMLITAIGMSLLLQNLALLLFGALRDFPRLLPERTWQPLGVIVRSNDLVILSVTLVLMVLLHHLIERTRIGRAMRAVSHSRDTAALMGIPVDRIIGFTFAVGSILAGAAAFLIAADKLSIRPDMGMTGGLKAFVAAVLGGIGSIPGAVAGGLLLGMSETLVSGYLASTWRDAIAFLLLIVILLFKPAGLFGRNTVEKV